MVNRVNGNDYYDYSKLKMPDAADKTGNGEKFSLNYQRANEEDEDKKDQAEEGKAAKTSGNAGQRTVVQSGVRLELSGSAQPSRDIKRDSTVQSALAGQGLFDTIRSWIADLTQSIKTFLYKVWNDETPHDTMAEQSVDEDKQNAAAMPENESVFSVGETKSTDEPERLTEQYLELQKLESLRNPEIAAKQQIQREADREKEIQKYLRSGNLEQVISLVTQNGQKTIAKNSTLLTYYDRTGKITPLSASDQDRILHGDRNVKKL